MSSRNFTGCAIYKLVSYPDSILRQVNNRLRRFRKQFYIRLYARQITRLRHRDDVFSDLEEMYKSGEPFHKTPQHNRARQTNLPLTMASVQKKRALDPETSDTMDSIKRKKVSLEGLVKEDNFNAKGKIECDIPRVSRTGALSSVTTKEDKVGEGKIGCDVPDAFRHDIANCTGIHDVEGYLKLKNGPKCSYGKAVVFHYFHFMNNHSDLIAKKRKRFPEIAKRLEEHYRNVLSPLPVRIFPWSSSLWEKIIKEHYIFILYHAFFLRTVGCCALHDPQRAEEHENIIREVWGD